MGLTKAEIRKLFFEPKTNKKALAGLVFSELDYKDQKTFIHGIGNSFISLFSINSLIPHSYNALISEARFYLGDFVRGLGCLSFQCVIFQKELNLFILKRDAFEKELLMGHYDNCLVLLDEIDHICFSLWAIQSRLLVIYLKDGSSAAIDYKDSFSKVESVLPIFVSLFWKKDEATYSLSLVRQSINQLFNAFNEVSEDTKAPFYNQILKYDALYKREDVLWSILKFSIIDAYQYLCEVLLLENFTEGQVTQIINIIDDLVACIDDNRLKSIYNKFHHGNNINSAAHQELLSRYEAGDFKAVLISFTSLLSTNLLDFDLIDIVCKSCIELGVDIEVVLSSIKGTLYAEIASCYYRYLAMGDDSSTAHSRLRVLANQLSHLKIGYYLNAVIVYWRNLNAQDSVLSFVNSECDSSVLCRTTVDGASDILHSETPLYLKEIALRIAYQDCFERGDFFGIAEMYVSAYLENIELVRNIDSSSLINKLDKLRVVINGDPFVVSMFLCMIDAPTYLIYQYFRHFFSQNNHIKPSDLFDEVLAQKKEYTIYFYSKVCSIRVLQLYAKLFISSEAVYRERLIILRKLSALGDSIVYLDEITNLNRILSIRKRVQELDERMIYVDELKLKEGELIEARKIFDIYIQTNEDIITREYSVLQQESLSIPVFENFTFSFENVKYRAALFCQLFNEIKKRFVASNKNGLEFYLSTRIRHGTLVNRLRIAFEKGGIVTNMSEGEYLPNVRIIDEVLHLEGKNREDAVLLLKKFSKELDENILFIKNEIVQVQSRDFDVQHSKGIFNYEMITNSVLLGLYQTEQWKRLSTFDELYDASTFFLWQITEECMVEMRTYLDRLKVEYVGKLQLLHQNLETLAGENIHLDELNDIFESVSSNVLIDIESVKKWFYRNKNDEGDFTINDAFETCRLSVVAHRNVELDYKSSGECETLLLGAHFRSITDLILIFFNNICDYQVLTGKKSPVTVNIESTEEVFVCTISNVVYKEDWPMVQSKIDNFNKNKDNPQYLAKTNKDKGSGLIKAINIVKKMFSYDKDAMVVELNKGRFVVKFKIDKLNLMVR